MIELGNVGTEPIGLQKARVYGFTNDLMANLSASAKRLGSLSQKYGQVPGHTRHPVSGKSKGALQKAVGLGESGKDGRWVQFLILIPESKSLVENSQSSVMQKSMVTMLKGPNHIILEALKVL